MSEMTVEQDFPFEAVSERLPAILATAQHVATMQRKIDQLLRMRDEAWTQMLTTAARGYADGLIGDLDLPEMLADMKASYGPGFSLIWNRHMPWAHSQVSHRALAATRNRPNAPHGSWSGEWPSWTDGPYPEDRVPVVYVLFDDQNEPAYVGSTERFVLRMSAHRKDPRKGSIRRWTAHRCDDREAAYALEERLLAEHKPRLNRRTTR